MAPFRPVPKPGKPWQVLLAPLPDEAIVRRQPVGSPEVLATPEGAAIAGWKQLTVELSAGSAGLRHVLVVLDASGQGKESAEAIAKGYLKYIKELCRMKKLEIDERESKLLHLWITGEGSSQNVDPLPTSLPILVI